MAPAVVSQRTGRIVRPDDILMRSICNADEQATGGIDRGRYIITESDAG